MEPRVTYQSACEVEARLVSLLVCFPAQRTTRRTCVKSKRRNGCRARLKSSSTFRARSRGRRATCAAGCCWRSTGWTTPACTTRSGRRGRVGDAVREQRHCHCHSPRAGLSAEGGWRRNLYLVCSSRNKNLIEKHFFSAFVLVRDMFGR